MITLDDLRSYVGITARDDADLERALTTGVALVDQYVGSAVVPVGVRDYSYLVAASEVFQRKSAPMGISQFATADGAPMRVNRDPLVSVYPLLQPFVGLGFA
ncbi:hypothetical protein [Frigoribacterium faeni]|uniref:Bacteriophage protein n=1 Tax=Frigoribacterium faeni TaxID=145483 RepID=A0A7W3JGN1_9MICO|nr:hypothetical protein [Frigoribacterium faeni]MBA8812425.1 hypothetical protein [Frigoribacterium faeni]BFF13498.1 hypothetical protein GCM10025699_48010 [Microbacterium flavescens]GEK81858.1 hypothetical protein FFA01_01670 [Frigoribacterium faeni]